jgi:hypothetical protein
MASALLFLPGVLPVQLLRAALRLRGDHHALTTTLSKYRSSGSRELNAPVTVCTSIVTIMTIVTAARAAHLTSASA